jgi:hypothetical protein
MKGKNNWVFRLGPLIRFNLGVPGKIYKLRNLNIALLTNGLSVGIRDVAPRVFVLVTDVSSIDSYRQAIDEIRTDGSDVAIFGVGSEIYKQEVKVRSSVQGLVDQVVTLGSADESEAAKHFAINMCKISNSKRTEIPRLTWKASDKVLNQN